MDKIKQHQPKPKPNYLASTSYCGPEPETDLVKDNQNESHIFSICFEVRGANLLLVVVVGFFFLSVFPHSLIMHPSSTDFVLVLSWT